MIAAGGTYEGKRYVSESAVREMTSTQTGKLLNNGKGEHGYGLGWSTSRYSKGDKRPVIPGPCGHGGVPMRRTCRSTRSTTSSRSTWSSTRASRGSTAARSMRAFMKAASESFGK